MDNARNEEAVRQFVQQFIAGHYGRAASIVEIRDVPKSGSTTSGSDARYRLKHFVYSLVIEVEGMERNILHIRDRLMEGDISELETWMNNHLRREILYVLGPPPKE
jgi:hypothetical protein